MSGTAYGFVTFIMEYCFTVKGIPADLHMVSVTALIGLVTFTFDL